MSGGEKLSEKKAGTSWMLTLSVTYVADTKVDNYSKKS